MSTARKTILDNITRALGPSTLDNAAIRAQADALIADPDRFQPKFKDQPNVERFIEKATSERVTATVTMIDTYERVPTAVAAYAAQNALEPSAALQPREKLTRLDWTGLKTHHELAANEPLAISLADFAIAETGSIVVCSAPDAPILMNFLPLHHIVVVEKTQIHCNLDDAFTSLGVTRETQPRNLCIITGTSGTADIEAKNIRGAHGPRFMHIVIIGRP